MYLSQIEAYKPKNEQELQDKKVLYHFCKENPHNVLLRSNEVAHLTSSGFIMNKDLTKVLVIFHKIYKAWGWTGGHVDGEKDLLKVAIKEAREETGVKVFEPLSKQIMSLDILPVWGHRKNGKYVSAHLHYNAAYILIADEEAPLIVNEKETAGVKWVNADEIKLHSTEAELLVVYEKLIAAARNYSASSELVIEAGVAPVTPKTMTSVLKESAVPIAIHETKSAYYKAKLAKELLSGSGKIIGKVLNKGFKK